MNNIEEILNKIGDSYDYFSPPSYYDELIMGHVDREFSYVSHELAVSKRNLDVNGQRIITAAKVIEEFLIAMEGGYDMEKNTMTFSEFVDDSVTVRFNARPDIRLHISYEEGVESDDQCLLVYKQNNEEVMTNDSIVNVAQILKQVL